jgi:peptidoglycan hydrolase-like protein with peptidoglycan-binding domain
MTLDTTSLDTQPMPWQETARLLPPGLLKLGDSGKTVHQLQQVLNDLDLYVGPLDGHFGTATERAILRLQRQLELRETGRLDNATWRALVDWANSPLF